MLRIKSTIYLTGQANNNTRRKRLRCAWPKFKIPNKKNNRSRGTSTCDARWTGFEFV